MASIRLGDLLVKAKVITDSQLKAALNEQQKWGGRLGELLVRMNFVTEEMLVKALSKQLNLVTVNLEAIRSVPPHVMAKIPVEVARDLVALPLQLRDDGKTLVVVMAEPQNLKHTDTLRSVSRCRIVTQIAGRQSIARAFSRFYDGEKAVEEVEGSFKMVDAQNNTIVKSPKPPVLTPGPAPARAAPALRQPAAVPPQPKGDGLPTSLANRPPSDMLRAIEEAQRREVTAIKGMIEILIEKGVFTREEYLAKVKRNT